MNDEITDEKGKMVEFEIEESTPKRKGLLALVGMWAEMEDIDRMVEDIYEARLRETDRGMEPLR